jgi:hypothetical protein
MDLINRITEVILSLERGNCLGCQRAALELGEILSEFQTAQYVADVEAAEVSKELPN